MCDPVTLTAVSGFASAQGASMLATYGTGTFLGSVGSGLVTASTFINTSSSIYKASAAVAGVAKVGYSVFNTVNAIGEGYQGKLRQDAARQTANLEQAKYEQQQKEYKAQIERDSIEARSEELDRRKRYLSARKSNISQMSASGVQAASNSYRALLESNRDQYLNDMSYTRLIATEKNTSVNAQMKGAKLASRIGKESYKTQAKYRTTDTLMNIGKALTS